MIPALYKLPIYDFDLRATHARTLLPAALAYVSFGFVSVRVRVLECATHPLYTSITLIAPTSSYLLLSSISKCAHRVHRLCS